MDVENVYDEDDRCMINHMLLSLSSSSSSLNKGSMSSLFCGALAGCCSWIPVYPFDVIKT